MPFCNTTLQNATVNNELRYSSGLTFHEIGLIISAAFGLTSIVLADYLIVQHAVHYLRPEEQKHIIRILFMIPIYSTVSFLSYYFYKHAIYFEVLGDCYEAFAIASFFTLLCTYIAPNLHEQKDYFRKQRPKNWIWPLPWMQKCTGGKTKGWLRKPISGLTWFNIVHVSVFQYCFVRVFFTLVSVITEYFGVYCESSDSLAFARIWVEVFESLSVCIAMYALIQFYYQLKEEIAEHKPFLKILCIKLVIFFSFWQTFAISFLSSSGVTHPTAHIAYPDIAIGIPSLLLCIEMAIFAVMHLFAFPWRKYSMAAYDPLHVPGSGFTGTPHYQGGWLGTKALLDAANPWDIIKASARGFRWLSVGRKHRHTDESYQQDQSEPYAAALKLNSIGYPKDVSPASFDSRAPSPAGQTGYTGGLDGRFPRSPVSDGMPPPQYDIKSLAPVYNAPQRGRAVSSASSWRPDAEDDNAWDTSIEPEDCIRRQSADVEDRAGLLRNAMRPAKYEHSDDDYEHSPTGKRS